MMLDPRLQVGESMEDCCAREVFEESGIRIDRSSIRFVASQPWPFPRSLMVGFTARADPPAEASTLLPEVRVDTAELEDARWFSRDFVAARLGGGSTAMEVIPTAREAEFHIPGQASLARVLITNWAME